VHKGTTVKELQQLLNVTEAETMTFGDGLNDVELMQAATYSFAMSNAFEETKKAAAFVTISNDENGVLSTIEKILALQAK
jgi:hydroxymethylpyrimidine pyrophosphatase-like HAD family hydrolase